MQNIVLALKISIFVAFGLVLSLSVVLVLMWRVSADANHGPLLQVLHRQPLTDLPAPQFSVCEVAAEDQGGTPEIVANIGHAKATIGAEAGRLLAGYGFFPFSPWGGRRLLRPDTFELSVSTVSLKGVIWVLVVVDTVGIDSTFSQKLKSEVKSVLERRGHGAACALVTLVASHTHSSVDVVGLWGGSTPSGWAAIRAAFFGDSTHERRAHMVHESHRREIADAVAMATAQALEREAPLKGVAWSHHSAPTTRSQGEHNIRVLSLVGARPENVLQFWFADAHAATDQGKLFSEPFFTGDFPEALRDLSASEFVFLPARIGNVYPIEKPDFWLKSWLPENLLGGTESVSPVSAIRLREAFFCVEPTLQLYSLLAFWKRRWVGSSKTPCGDSRLVRVEVQQVHIAGRELVFTPFELFHELAFSLEHSKDVPREYVSLANGILGYGLSAAQFCTLISSKSGTSAETKRRECELAGTLERSRAKPYHSLTAVFSEAESLLQALLIEK